MNKNQKGFTIIELIVVIAIIAVLASIVLVNVTQYINKGRDAAIKGNMNTIFTNSSVYFDDPTTFGGSSTDKGTYTNFDTLKGYTLPKAAITTIKDAPVYVGTTGAFCVTAGLYDATTYCIDSTGFKGTLATGKCTSASPAVYTCN